MFGKSEWFRYIGSFPFPKTRQGAWYWAGWLATIAIPAGVMFAASLSIEMLIWLAISVLAMYFDVRSINSAKARREELDNLHYISLDDDDLGKRAETENYELSSK